jgi:hypothetical protein
LSVHSQEREEIRITHDFNMEKELERKSFNSS